jgi:hypothetical protein
MEGSGHCAGGGNQADFTGPFRSVAPDFVGYFNQDDVDLWRMFGLGDTEVAQQQ